MAELEVYKNILHTSFKKTLQYNHRKLGIIGSDITILMQKNWIGTLLCGPSCVTTTAILKNHNIDNVRVFMNKRGFGEIYEDHVFITVGNIIIDPTYKQFLTITNIDDFFVGYQTHLFHIVNKYGKNGTDMRHWDRSLDITDNVLKFINNTGLIIF